MPDITKEQLYIILAIIVVILIGCVIGVYNKNFSQKQSSPVSSPKSILIENPAKNEANSIYVHISGAVKKEGVYKLNKNDRLIDLLRLSGVSVSAYLDSINLAEPLSDGQKIVIPSKSCGQSLGEQSAASAKRSANAIKKVNINTADEKQLDNLPGIGPVMAKRIVDYRQEKGRFMNVEDLKTVEGITGKRFEKIRDHISIN